ncbi:MAG TPA: LysR family transcriptional regulator [Hyphomicrobiaceae bacterium]|nr:LysR family transcriptional regulator [Hyphomicrobiaceae bacterium]
MDIDELDLRKLRAFHLVVKLGSLRRAAIRLNITVPAVSLSIRRLEHQLGMPLFQRRPNRMILTPAGARLAQGVELILREVHTVFNPIASETSLQGRFRLAINSDLVWYFVPRIAAFIKANPEVELGVDIRSSSEALVEVQRGDIDIAIGRYDKVPKGVEKEPIMESSVSLVCPEDHPILRKRTPQIGDIGRYRLVTLPSRNSTRRLINKAFFRARIKLHNCIEAGTCQTVCSFVESGLGVGLVHTLCAGRDGSGKLRYRELSHCFGSVEFSAVYRNGRPVSPVFTRMLEVCTAPDDKHASKTSGRC